MSSDRERKEAAAAASVAVAVANAAATAAAATAAATRVAEGDSSAEGGGVAVGVIALLVLLVLVVVAVVRRHRRNVSLDAGTATYGNPLYGSKGGHLMDAPVPPYEPSSPGAHGHAEALPPSYEADSRILRNPTYAAVDQQSDA